MQFPVKLKAYANPFAGGFHSLDRKGRGHAYASVLGAPDRILGAVIDLEASKLEDKLVLTFSGEVFDLGVHDSTEWAHYRQQFLDGVLVAADEASAKSIGLKFVDPIPYLARCKTAALDAFARETAAPDIELASPPEPLMSAAPASPASPPPAVKVVVASSPPASVPPKPSTPSV